MTRTEAKELLIQLGIAEPTEDNINDMLNGIGRNSKAKDDLVERSKSRIAELEKEIATHKAELEERNNANLTDLEKLQKQIATLQEQSEKDKATIKAMNFKTGLAEKGIIGEQADKLINAMSKGEFDFETLGQILEEREKTAIANYEKKALEGTPNPNGGNDNGNDNGSDKVISAIAQNIVGTNKSSESIISSYL